MHTVLSPLFSSAPLLVSSSCRSMSSLKDKCQTRRVTVNKQLQQPEEELIERYF